MFNKVLIANRGEIAARIARTCRELGIDTVAVYSEADAGAMHVAACDEAVLLGPAAAGASYLRVDRIIEAARRTGAEALHPGYGFLSENAALANACADAGIVWIGPPSNAIELMGSKSAAKARMEEAGVPLVPGYHGDDQDDATLSAEAERIGYPVLIKASAGGGGKGMRRVNDAGEFAAGLAAARREATAAFGDDRMLIERCLVRPRHVEVQVFCDGQGNCVHLFERDCSVQRRHQKVVEEAPAPGLSEARRTEMGQAAVRAAEAIGYVGAGTVEFITDDQDAFYFMEMNTRLQVEHPVTEMVTGQDLVAWQLRVAAGEPLPVGQEALALEGHAFEARIYAEDPRHDFMPSTGTIHYLATPEPGRHVRVDAGVRQGDAVSVHYDPMIAKLVVWDSDRARAATRLQRALAEFQVVGPTTNLDFLRALAAHPAFTAGTVHTGFIDEHRSELIPAPVPAPGRVLAAACLAELLRVEEAAAAAAHASGDPFSPWWSTSGWVMNDDNHHTLHLRDGDRDIAVVAHYRPGHFLLELPEGTCRAAAHRLEGYSYRVELDGVRFTVEAVARGAEINIVDGGSLYRLTLHDPLTAGMEDEVREGSLTAPMPGQVIQVLVGPGQRVREGETLMVLTAMKMELTISAPADGVVEAVHYRVNDQVEEGQELLTMARPTESDATEKGEA